MLGGVVEFDVTAVANAVVIAAAVDETAAIGLHDNFWNVKVVAAEVFATLSTAFRQQSSPNAKMLISSTVFISLCACCCRLLSLASEQMLLLFLEFLKYDFFLLP